MGNAEIPRGALEEMVWGVKGETGGLRTASTGG